MHVSRPYARRNKSLYIRATGPVSEHYGSISLRFSKARLKVHPAVQNTNNFYCIGQCLSVKNDMAAYDKLTVANDDFTAIVTFEWICS